MEKRSTIFCSTPPGLCPHAHKVTDPDGGYYWTCKDKELPQAALEQIESELGEEEARKTIEDIAQLLAQHELTRNPALCDKLFRYMSAVVSGWNSL